MSPEQIWMVPYAVWTPKEKYFQSTTADKFEVLDIRYLLFPPIDFDQLRGYGLLKSDDEWLRFIGLSYDTRKQWRSQGGGAIGQLPSTWKFIAQRFLEMMVIAQHWKLWQICGFQKLSRI